MDPSTLKEFNISNGYASLFATSDVEVSAVIKRKDGKKKEEVKVEKKEKEGGGWQWRMGYLITQYSLS
jgi:hypothetical protein